MQDYYYGSVCTDCYDAYRNGADEVVSEDWDREAYLNSGTWFPGHNSLEDHPGENCTDGCEDPWFGTSSCDACNGHLHGDRFAVSFVLD